MNIQELSVGDWIKTNDEDYRGARECTIQNIEKWRNNYVLVVKFKDVSIDTLGSCCFDPIPLTTEILEKNGLEFIDDGNDAIIFLCSDMYWAKLCVGDCFWSIGVHSKDRLDAVICDVKYVHQLQHALRLAGIEKDIVL